MINISTLRIDLVQFDLFFTSNMCSGCFSGGRSHVALADQQDESDETDVSLITGALRSRSLLNGEPAGTPDSSSVVLRNQTLTVANANSAGRSTCSISRCADHVLMLQS